LYFVVELFLFISGVALASVNQA